VRQQPPDSYPSHQSRNQAAARWNGWSDLSGSCSFARRSATTPRSNETEYDRAGKEGIWSTNDDNGSSTSSRTCRQRKRRLATVQSCASLQLLLHLVVLSSLCPQRSARGVVAAYQLQISPKVVPQTTTNQVVSTATITSGAWNAQFARYVCFPTTSQSGCAGISNTKSRRRIL
jgi:hypothetical protein